MSFSLLDILFPRTCACCETPLNSHEQEICLHCLSDRPTTNYHFQQDNEVGQRFDGKIPYEHATAYLSFQKGSRYREAIHLMKYHHRPHIGTILGRYAAAELQQVYADATLLLPIPLHPARLRRRGYNQSLYIARGMSQIMQIPIDERSVIRTVKNETQTARHGYERYLNTRDIFRVIHPESLSGQHILIVDDVVTTGSTIESCAHAILQAATDVRISIFALAAT